jgi:ribosome-associated heat shock protein Hsp15
MNTDTDDSQRLDRWLYHARFFKTRTLAVDAIRNGRIEVNEARAKPARLVRAGDRLEIRRPPFTYEIEVIGLATQRVSAKLLKDLYHETETSVAARLALAERLKLNRIVEDPGQGRPDKHEREAREKFKREFE